MKINLTRFKKVEKYHYLDAESCIFSFFNTIFYKTRYNLYRIKLPVSFLDRALGFFRVTRRLMRLDMCNVFLSKGKGGLIIIRNGVVYHYNVEKEKLTKTLKLKQCRSILHQSMCETNEGYLYFGEYGMNPKRDSVNVYRSQDNGKSWEIIYTFPAGKIRHVHGCYFDKYSNKIWTLTGDFEGENIIQCSDLDFKKIETFGDGSQSYRAVSLFFTKKEVHWMMDSPLEKSYQFCLNEMK